MDRPLECDVPDSDKRPDLSRDDRTRDENDEYRQKDRPFRADDQWTDLMCVHQPYEQNDGPPQKARPPLKDPDKWTDLLGPVLSRIPTNGQTF